MPRYDVKDLQVGQAMFLQVIDPETGKAIDLVEVVDTAAGKVWEQRSVGTIIMDGLTRIEIEPGGPFERSVPGVYVVNRYTGEKNPKPLHRIPRKA